MEKKFVYVQISITELKRISEVIGNEYTLEVTFCDRNGIFIDYDNGETDIYSLNPKYTGINYINKSQDAYYKSIFLRYSMEVGLENSKVSFKIKNNENTLFLVSYPCSNNVKDEKILFDENTGLYPNCFVIHNNNVKEDSNNNVKIRKYNRYYTMIYNSCVVNPIFIYNENINKMRLSGPWIDASLLYKYVDKYNENNNLISLSDVDLMFKRFDEKYSFSDKRKNREIIIYDKCLSWNDGEITVKDEEGNKIFSIIKDEIYYEDDIDVVRENGFHRISFKSESGLFFVEGLSGIASIPYKREDMDTMECIDNSVIINPNIISKDINKFTIKDNGSITMCIVNKSPVFDEIFNEVVDCGCDYYIMNNFDGYFARMHDICTGFKL